MVRSTHKPDARVANYQSGRIDKVDGVPSTHKQRGWVTAWTSSDGVIVAQPFPVAAKRVPSVFVVSIMALVVIGVAVMSVLAVLGVAV